MLEVDNIMRFYFIFFKAVFIATMLNKFPETFWFVLVDDIDSPALRFLYIWPIFCKLISNISFLEGCHIVWPVKYDRDFSIWEVHITVSLRVVDSQTVIIVYHITRVFV